MTRHHILVIAGTRPEVIKMAPVVRELERRADRFALTFATTGQHREMLDQALRAFGLSPDHDLRVMTPSQTLPELTARTVSAVADYLAATRPAAPR